MNTVEGQVLQNRINVDKAQYQNQHNKLRIEQAEQEIKELAEVGEAVEEVSNPFFCSLYFKLNSRPLAV